MVFLLVERSPSRSLRDKGGEGCTKLEGNHATRNFRTVVSHNLDTNATLPVFTDDETTGQVTNSYILQMEPLTEDDVLSCMAVTVLA